MTAKEKLSVAGLIALIAILVVGTAIANLNYNVSMQNIQYVIALSGVALALLGKITSKKK